MDLVVHGIDTGVRQSTDADEAEVKNRAITEDGEEAWEGTKGRYCSGNMTEIYSMLSVSHS